MLTPPTQIRGGRSRLLGRHGAPFPVRKHLPRGLPVPPDPVAKLGSAAGYGSFVATRIAHRTLNQIMPSWSRQTRFPPNFRVPFALAISSRARVAASADCSAL